MFSDHIEFHVFKYHLYAAKPKRTQSKFPSCSCLLHSVVTLYRHPAYATPSVGVTQASSFPNSYLHWPDLLRRRPSNVLGLLFLSICKSLSSLTLTTIIPSSSSLCSHSCFPFTRVAKVIFKNIYLKSTNHVMFIVFFKSSSGLL